MMKVKGIPVGLQLYSVRGDVANDMDSALREVKAMGYEGVEFAGLFGHDPEEVKELCDRHGLVPVSAHVPYAEMMADPRKIFGDYAEIGCRYVAIPHVAPEYRPGGSAFNEIIKNAAMLGKAANDSGITLLYHNHDFEFVKIDGKYGLDILYDSVPASLLQTELDTCWVNVGGENPVDYLLRYAGRAPVVHLKDFAGKKSEKMYALIGVDDNLSPESRPVGEFQFRPLGSGLQNVPAIVDASAEAGARWLIVEQDSPSMDLSPMECAKRSADYLKTL